MAARSEDLVTFDDGPWNGWWMTADALEANRTACELTGTGADTARRYVETKADRQNPEGYGSGRVWTWRAPDPNAVVCRLCSPLAAADTATFCDSCSPDTSRRVVTVVQPVIAERPAPVPPQTCTGCERPAHLADGLCLSCRLTQPNRQEAK